MAGPGNTKHSARIIRERHDQGLVPSRITTGVELIGGGYH